MTGIRKFKFAGHHFYTIAAATLLMLLGLAVVQMHFNSGAFSEHFFLGYTPQMPQHAKEFSRDLHDGLQLRSIVNLPDWYRNRSWGLRKDSSLENVPIILKAGDAEEETAWNNFFFGTTNGLVLEMGAMNGNDFSVSYFFEKAAKWRSILIEGNPTSAVQLSINRPNALNFNAAICDKPRLVHMREGILEFMSIGYLEKFLPGLLTFGALDISKAEAHPNVFSVQCLPMLDILSPLNISHINFFVLDVDGGETRVLNAIDFNAITFDVIVVETDRGSDSLLVTNKYVDDVTAILEPNGYILWQRKIGRNSWYISKEFEPYKNNTV